MAAMQGLLENDRAQAKIMAQAVYEIRLLLGGYLGSQNTSDMPVRQAAHLAYALHNQALSVLEGTPFDVDQAIKSIQGADQVLGQNLALRFETHRPEKDSGREPR